jgi:hypothetical protein
MTNFGWLSEIHNRPRLQRMNESKFSARELVARVEASDTTLKACLEDSRSDVLARFTGLNPAQQEQLARESWRIGLSAVLTAHASAQEAKLADVGRTLVEDVTAQLEQHLERQQSGMKAVMDRFFDPKDGQVTERLQAFVADKGVLANKLNEFFSGDGSVLAQTLARQVGENSPLLKRLSPTESEGVVQLLERQVKAALAANRDDVTKALDPAAEGTPVARFLSKLQKELKEAGGAQSEQLAKALAALDQNDERSLVSRLVRESRASQESLRKALNPQAPDSPLGIVRKTLEELLEQRLGRHDQRLEALQKAQAEFQLELCTAVARLETRKNERAGNPQGGDDFEGRVLEFLTHASPTGACVVEATGSTAGAIKGCKVGDAVVRFTEESAFFGSAMVVEAKRNRTYQVGDALSELETAMRNRGATTGLFVLAKASASPTFPRFARYGSKLLVVWDADDEVSSGLLHGAIIAGLALAQRKNAVRDGGDINALADIENRLLKEVERLEKMDCEAEKIGKSAGKIRDEVRKATIELRRVVDKGKATLRALQVEVHEEQVEVENPITADAYRSGAPYNDAASAA